MILIHCPYCGEREQSEFTNGGEAHVIRPKNPEALSDKEWGNMFFIVLIQKVFFMKDGFTLMGVENGLML
jgi:heterotetrameric sarcosine oxidase delta subunit